MGGTTTAAAVVAAGGATRRLNSVLWSRKCVKSYPLIADSLQSEARPFCGDAQRLAASEIPGGAVPLLTACRSRMSALPLRFARCRLGGNAPLVGARGVYGLGIIPESRAEAGAPFLRLAAGR